MTSIKQLKSFRNQALAEETEMEKEKRKVIYTSIEEFTNISANKIYLKMLDLIGEEIMKREIKDHVVIDMVYDDILSKIKSKIRK
jgi:hypothetical protein